MDNEGYSDEGTSAENVPIQNSKVCVGCDVAIEKSQPFTCAICEGKLCEACSFFIPCKVKRICVNCEKRIKMIEANSIKQTELLKRRNKEVTSEIIAGFKDLQEIKNTMKVNWNDIKKTEEIHRNTESLTEDFKDSIRILVCKQKEKNDLLEKINKIQCDLYEKNGKLTIINNAVNHGEIDKKHEEIETKDKRSFMSENHELTKKIKEMEIDHYFFTKEMLESLQQLKIQILREKSEAMFRRKSEVRALETCDSFEDLSRKRKLLEEELCIVKQKIDMLAYGFMEEKAWNRERSSKFLIFSSSRQYK